MSRLAAGHKVAELHFKLQGKFRHKRGKSVNTPLLSVYHTLATVVVSNGNKSIPACLTNRPYAEFYKFPCLDFFVVS